MVWRPGARGEHVIVGPVESCLRLVLPERLRERGHENYIAHGAHRLGRHVQPLAVERRANVNQLIVEVDIPPVQSQELALAESTKDRCGKESSETRCRCFEEESDLLGVEDRSFLPRDTWPLAAVELAHGVCLDQSPTHRMP